MTGVVPTGLLVARLTGGLFEVVGRTEEGPRQPYVSVSAFATDGFMTVSDMHLAVYFRAWPLLDPKGPPTVRPPLPMGCRWCGSERLSHYRWSTLPVGLHLWAEPSAEQVKRRMWLRREMRLSTHWLAGRLPG